MQKGLELGVAFGLGFEALGLGSGVWGLGEWVLTGLLKWRLLRKSGIRI